MTDSTLAVLRLIPHTTKGNMETIWNPATGPCSAREPDYDVLERCIAKETKIKGLVFPG